MRCDCEWRSVAVMVAVPLLMAVLVLVPVPVPVWVRPWLRSLVLATAAVMVSQMAVPMIECLPSVLRAPHRITSL